MAKIRLGAIITDIRGKVGGHFFSSGQGGSIMATNGPTVQRSMGGKKLWGYIKKSVEQNSQQWQVLSDPQRAAWFAEAANWPDINNVGNTIALRGYSLFMKVNGILNSVGKASVTIPSPKTVLTSITSLTIPTLNTGAFTVNGTFSLTTSEVAVVAATRSMSNGRLPGDNDFRIVHIIPDGSIVPVSIYTEYVAIFGAPLQGGFITIKSYVVNFETGQVGVPSLYKKVVS